MITKSLAALAVALVALGGPVASNAGDGAACAVLHDPIHDPHHAWNPFVDAPMHPSDAVDLTGVAMSYDEHDLTVVIGILDVSGAVTPGTERADFTVTWRTPEGSYVDLVATRTPAGWTYGWMDSLGSTGVAAGTVDPARNTITMSLPLQAAGAAEGTTLDRIRASSLESLRWGIPGNADRAPNLDGILPRFVLDGSCAGTSTAGAVCGVLTREDAGTVADANGSSGSTALEAVSFSARADALLVHLRVADLAEPSPGDGERWEVHWLNPRLFDGREQQMAFAQRTGARVEFGYLRDRAGSSTTGLLDEDTNTITIEVPRKTLRLLDGTRLTQIEAIGMETNGSLWTYQSQLPEGGDLGEWVVGDTCSAIEVQTCPVVVDRAGDARYAEATDEVPENYAGLDLRAVGAYPADAVVSLEARVENLRASDPPGAEVAGWTISWLDGDSRVYAQAERYPEGLVFRYGSRASDGDAPSGPVFAGTATTGEVDTANNVVRIDIPRSAMPAEGTSLDGFGATAWALSGRNTASMYLVWDETTSRSYLTGAVCAL